MNTRGRNTGAWALVVSSLLWGTAGTAASLLPGDISPLTGGASAMTFGSFLLFAMSAP